MKAIVFTLLVCVPGVAHAQSTMRASFSDPDQPTRVVARTIYGNIEVAPHAESDVLIEVTTRKREADEPTAAGSGLRRIDQGSNVTIDENDNTVYVKAGSEDYFTDLRIRMPRSSDLTINVKGDGDIVVREISGEIEANASNGKITIEEVAGPVVAHAHAGDLTATFASVPGDRPMAFSSWSGTVDVALPSSISARLKMRTSTGEILSDFDLSDVETGMEDTGENGRQRLRSFTYATVNGGGPEYMFQNYSGDILIRRR